MVPDAEEFRVHCDIEVRFRDLDALGHVNNAVYLTYFEMARVRYMQRLGHEELDGPPGKVFPFVLLDVYCRYHSPVVLGERVRVYIRCSRIGTSSFEFEYRMESLGDGRLVASGRSTQVHFDYSAGRAVPVPDWLREKVKSLEGRAV
ncbi:MAG: acyl-CoA thioesterase [Deltaproteobacteria bacterium]|nr:MAG: acyl-CoA thioesterase [Deltaproteobacteria bacterium]